MGSWQSILEIIGAIAAVVVAVIKWWSYAKGRRDANRDALMKSAEELAAASQRVTKEARKTAHEIESLGPDTPVSAGNKLLSGSETHDGT